MTRVRKPKVDKSGRTSAGILLWRERTGRLEVPFDGQRGPRVQLFEQFRSGGSGLQADRVPRQVRPVGVPAAGGGRDVEQVAVAGVGGLPSSVAYSAAPGRTRS